MLCFAAIIPHPPILIPNIGKDKLPELEKTKRAFLLLEQDLYLAKPHTIIIISPHIGLYDDSFAVNAHTHFVSKFSEFGDLTTRKEWPGAPDLAAKIAHASHGTNTSIQLTSVEELDHGATVPLYYLTDHLLDVKVLPLGFSRLSASDHVLYGELLGNIIMESDKRIAVVASGDLSHGLDEAGTDAKKQFDEDLRRLITNRSIGSIMALENEAAAADECGYRSILILLGILKNMDYRFTTHAYEHPFGVGYLTGSFSF